MTVQAEPPTKMLDFDIELEAAPQVVVVPSDLADALESDPPVLRAFEYLSYGEQRSLVRSVEGAKTPATRLRRIDKSLATLRQGRER